MPTDKLNLDFLPRHLTLLLEQEKKSEIQALLSQFRPEDVAEILLQLEEEQIRQVLTWIDAELASELVIHIDSDYWHELLTPLNETRLVEIIEELPSDEAADLLNELDDELSEKILESQANSESFRNLSNLLQYPDDAAGALMNPDIVYVPESLNTDQALAMIRENIESFKDINYIYITDEKQRLTGVLPLPSLIAAPHQSLIEEVMSRDVIAVDVMMDEDDVVDIVRKYELMTVPVIDVHQRLIGIITVDDIMDVMEEQADEEAYKMAALGDPDNQSSAFEAAMARIPWLLVCLGGSMSAGTIIHLYQSTLEQAIVLASFMPAVMGMAGNTGVQTSTLLIRNMGGGPTPRHFLWRMVLQEFRTAFVIGLLCGSIASSVAFFLFHANPWIGGVIGLSLCLSILFSTFLGTSIPFLFQKFSIDPAVASGPFVTTINDSTALIIYLGIASAILPFLH
ncbi:magnesium transporter [bacterium (Candidatus Blackallbacteria) CG17_big_fil_post_rev_8_21_14_2_50_48_46]|uniref:Magnesium transporter MgtE n=1 Tax=bacterium (Candidatus Blackallbacteria) CG17_big_fil_post_rev_8_21_14_2_50_48_46 TaxID=2014261 RepID=A0A2M7G3C3_9BACT|nr:MAG: magnesium transporter [bacterium (Candidatus Blackallbacteria) CG18_big_fil_WC_8_21_14_2_50_49_26]PIW16338.1 MAG: magnesium transporter [bacterium (Candidatus Blackallbacteria) CG17_big_fil_post_rev_8_21_14_2_50_48_46]PIW45352.1 MAG: magnesium transporter [bacterium (Candidatus Blackallbacteria) CG13_big_fil_rev_8_21_14_2_50_49_14]